jgi:hypothetical protein
MLILRFRMQGSIATLRTRPWLASGWVSFAKTLRGRKPRRVTMLQAHPHAIHFKHILYFGEGHGQSFGEPQQLNADRGVPFVMPPQ